MIFPRTRSQRAVWTVLATVLVWLNCEAPRRDIIARFKGGVVTKTEYLEQFANAHKNAPNEFPTRDNLERIVRKKAYEQLVLAEARRKIPASDSAFVALIEKNTQRILYQAFVQKYMVSTVISDSLVAKYYRELYPQHKMSYIIRPVFKHDTPQQQKVQKDTIEYAYRLLKQGKPFAAVAKTYSQDFTTNYKGGEIGFVIRESLGDAALRSVMDTLKAFHYSAPFRGYEGYYILLKGEEKTGQALPFAEAEPIIRKALNYSRRHEVNEKIDREYDRLRGTLDLQVFPSLVNRIITAAGGDSTGDPSQSLNLKKLSEADLLQPVGRFAGQEFTLFAALRERKGAPETAVQLREAIDHYLRMRVFARQATILGMDQQPDVKADIERMTSGTRLMLFNDRFIKQVINKKIDSLRLAVAPDMKERARYIRQESLKIEDAVAAAMQARLLQEAGFTLLEAEVPALLEQARLRKIEQNQAAARKAPQ